MPSVSHYLFPNASELQKEPVRSYYKYIDRFALICNFISSTLTPLFILIFISSDWWIANWMTSRKEF